MRQKENGLGKKGIHRRDRESVLKEISGKQQVYKEQPVKSGLERQFLEEKFATDRLCDKFNRWKISLRPLECAVGNNRENKMNEKIRY